MTYSAALAACADAVQPLDEVDVNWLLQESHQLFPACSVSQHVNCSMRVTSTFHEVVCGLSALLGHGRVSGAVET